MNPTIASYLEQGRQLEARGDVVGAIKLYSGLLKTAPDEAAVHVQLASCYDRIGRTADAVKYLQHVRGTPAMQPRQQYNPATGQTETDAHAQAMIDAALSAMSARAAQPGPMPGNPAQAAPMPNMQPQAAAPIQQQPAAQGFSPYQIPGGQTPDPRMNMPGPEPVDPRMAAFDPRIAQQQPQMGYPAGRPVQAQPGVQAGAQPGVQPGYAAQGYPQPGAPGMPGGRPTAPQMGSPAGLQNPQMPGYAGGVPGQAPNAPAGFESRMQTQTMAAEMTDYDPMSTRGYDPLAGYDQQPELPPGVGAYDPRMAQQPGRPAPQAQPPMNPANPYAQAQPGAQPGYNPAPTGNFPQQPGPQGPYPGGMNPQPGYQQPYPGQPNAFSKAGYDAGYTGGMPAVDPYGNPYAETPSGGGLPPALIVVLCVLFPPAGLILLFRRESPFEGTMRTVLAIVGGFMTILYVVLLYFLLSGNGAAQRSNPTAPDNVATTFEPTAAPPTATPDESGSASISPTSSPAIVGEVQSFTSGSLVISTTRVRLLTEKPKDKDRIKPKEGHAFLNVQCTIKNTGDKDVSFKIDKAFTLEDLDANKIYTPVPYHTMTGTMPITALNEWVCEPYFEVPIGASRFQLNVRVEDGKEPFAFAVNIDPDQKPLTPAEAEPE